MQLAGIHDVRMHPDQRPRIEARVRGIENLQVAREYVDHVAVTLRRRLQTERSAVDLGGVRRTSQGGRDLLRRKALRDGSR